MTLILLAIVLSIFVGWPWQVILLCAFGGVELLIEAFVFALYVDAAR